MRKLLLLVFTVSLFVGNLSAQKSKKDSTFVKIILNGKFKFFPRFQDTTVFIRKDNKWFIQRNGERDTIDFVSDDVKKDISKGNVKVVIDSVTKKVTYKVIHYRFNGHWSGFELGLNSFFNSNGKMELPDNAKAMELNTGKSWAFHWNFLQVNAGLFKNNIGLVTGLGLNLNHYNFTKPVTLNSRDSAYTFFSIDTTVNYKKNKLFVGYITLPLILEFQLHKKHRPAKTSFFVSGGVIGSIKIASRQKQIFTDNYTFLNRSDFRLAPLKLDATARIGNDTFTLFANYAITTLFETNKGPVMYPFTVGLGFVF